MEFTHYVVLLVGVAACAWDVRTRRIPNALTMGASLAGVAVHAWLGGVDGLLTSVAGWALGLALLFPFFALRGMGAGDVKLLAAFGAWLGAGPLVPVALTAGVAGGLIGLGLVVANGSATATILNLRTLVTTWTLMGPCPVPGLTLDDAEGPRLAYAIPLTIGAVVGQWL